MTHSIGRCGPLAPHVTRHNDEIMISGQAGDEIIGLLLSPNAATTTALRLLALVQAMTAEQGRASVTQARAAIVSGRTDAAGERHADITFEVEGVHLHVSLDLDGLAEFAAALAALSRAADSPDWRG